MGIFDENSAFGQARQTAAKKFDGGTFEELWVPGRIEIIGKHTDYAKGRSLVCAVDVGLAFCYRFTHEPVIAFCSAQFPNSKAIIYFLNNLDESLQNDELRDGPARYISSTIQYVTQIKKWELRGVQMVVNSTLPHSAGLSSSSALVCGVAAILTEAAGKPRNSLSVDELGLIESGDLVGTRGGTQDHAAVMMSKEGQLMSLNYEKMTSLIKYTPMPSMWVFVIAVCGVFACKTGNALARYNALATSSSELKSERARKESLNVDSAVVGFSEADSAKLRTAILNSQAHAENELGTTIPETEALPKLAAKIHGCIAGTTFGAGFGGAVYAIVDSTLVDPKVFMDEWKAAYLMEYPQHKESAKFFLTKPSQGATFRK